jgi:pimeloyl-ACP methyl ester carboxylesterase
MRRGWKIAIGVVVLLVVLLAINTIAVEGETKPAQVTEPGGRILHLQGGDVQVVDRGPRSASPIVLIHCFTCGIDWWNRMMPLLLRGVPGSGGPHRVVAIDLLGFGGSEKPGSGYSMEDQAKLVAEALDRLGVEEATVVGHSMGGAVATALSELPGSPVARLVDIDQAPDDENFGDGLGFTAELSFLPILGPAIWQVIPDSEIRKGLGKAFAPGYDVPDEFVEEFKRMTYTSYHDAAQAEDDFLSEEPLDRRLRETGVPLLAIFGAEDQIFEAKKSLAAYARVPGAKTALILGAGHSPDVEKPSGNAGLVLEFAAEGASGHEVQNGVQNRRGVRGRP